MSNGDKQFEDYLDGKSELSRRYKKLGDTEPPTDLDAAILAKAEQAVKVRWLPSHSRKWMVPVSIAATIMIAFSLVLNVMREASQHSDADPYFDVIVPAESPAVPAASQSSEGKLRSLALPSGVLPEKPDGAGRVDQGESALAQQGYSQTQKPEATDDLGSGRLEELAESTDRRATSEIVVTARQRQERFEDSPAIMAVPDATQMAAGDLDRLGQMMEIVEGYLDTRPASIEAGALDFAEPGLIGSMAIEDSEKSSSEELSRLSADEKFDRAVQEQAATAESESELRRIAELFALSKDMDVVEALAEFRNSFPDHPVSRLLLERGY